jgi:RNA polymerase sigma-70 factor (sigma-E family)
MKRPGAQEDRLDCPEEFTEFAVAYAARLRRTAYLLCGNWHTAEDLTQIALTQTLLSWRRLNRLDNAPAYAHRTLVNAYLGQRRSRKSGELPLAMLPESASPAGTAELRLVLVRALESLTPSARAIVVLRYWEDLSIDQVAAILRCSTGNVKSQTSRALAQLRVVLGSSLTDIEMTD